MAETSQQTHEEQNAAIEATLSDAQLVRLKTIRGEKVVPTYTNKSFFFIPPGNGFRKLMIQVAHANWFDNVIITIILVNCVFMCLTNPGCQTCEKFLDCPADKKCTETQEQLTEFVESSELVFTILFTIEMVVKMVAMGFFWDKGSYLRDPWNWLDFIVVVMGYVSMLPGVENVSALRTFRILRPLKTMTTIPGMKVIVKSILAAMPALFNVLLLTMFVFFVFGIFGIQLWTGTFFSFLLLYDASTVPTNPGA